ncbi:xanthine/uracil family permease [Actinobacillus lignieresii]|nr:xanthine/uracil family permease [Actinobacillus lignieresii]
MLERLFQLSAKGSNAKTEIVAGITTFFTMVYIVFVNPSILGVAGMDTQVVFVTTCLIAAFGRLRWAYSVIFLSHLHRQWA